MIFCKKFFKKISKYFKYFFMDSSKEVLNIDLIQYNKCIITAYDQFKSGEYENSMNSYQEALKIVQKSNDNDRIALIESHIAVIYFYNCEYRNSCNYLERALENLVNA